jgi:dipeptidyl aminopeptidase/acylaminoacyl peptidase
MGDSIENRPKRRIAAADLYRTQVISDPQMSPDGARVAYTIRSIDPDHSYHSRIEIYDLVAHTACRLLYGPDDSGPRWSPDSSRLAFLSKRCGSRQIWVMSTQSGEVHQITDVAGGVSHPRWSPDGTRIAFNARVEGTDVRSRPRIAEPGSDVIEITRLAYKSDGEGFWDGTWSHIFCVNADGSGLWQLTEGDFDHGSPVWSPDGSRVAFAAKLSRDADCTEYTDIWVLALTGGPPTRVSSGEGHAECPTWSPDGLRIAFYGHTPEYDRSSNLGIWVVDSHGGTARNLTEGFDYTAEHTVVGDMVAAGNAMGGPAWVDGRLLFTAVVRGSSHLCSVSAGGGEVSVLTPGDQVVLDFTYRPGTSQVVLLVSDPTNICDLYCLDLRTGEGTRLTKVNEDVLSGISLSTLERCAWAGDGGTMVEGYLMKPIGFELGKRYPMIVENHGGSHMNFGPVFFYEFQLLAAQGYVVFSPNPRGSQGYGQKFARENRLDWGGKEYRDVISGVDHVLGLGFVDPDGLGVTGGSFGGYMTNWIIGHTTRFRAAVTCRSTCNRYSNWGTSDWGWMNGNWEWPGAPWESTAFYMERSPISYVDRITTPLLIVHSSDDHRCALEQAEQLYHALKFLKRPVEWTLFRSECHEMSRAGRPANRVERLRRVLGWFNRHIPRNPGDYEPGLDVEAQV